MNALAEALARYEACHAAHVNTENDLALVREECRRLRDLHDAHHMEAVKLVNKAAQWEFALNDAEALLVRARRELMLTHERLVAGNEGDAAEALAALLEEIDATIPTPPLDNVHAALPNAEALARRFHEAYERLAQERGYETRPESRIFSPFTKNGSLMVAVCAELLRDSPAHVTGAWLR